MSWSSPCLNELRTIVMTIDANIEGRLPTFATQEFGAGLVL